MNNSEWYILCIIRHELKTTFMKTIKKYLISLSWLLGLLFVSVNGHSQDMKVSRQDKKEARKAMMAENYRILDSLLTEKRFVLEADFLQNEIGERAPVASRLNFIKIDGERGVLQTGSDLRVGYNGFGGVTAEGDVVSWKILKDKKSLSYRVSFNLLTKIGAFHVFMTVTSENRATATISGSTSGKLTWDGHLITINNSRVFKGMETF
jgi:hypothetical protein